MRAISSTFAGALVLSAYVLFLAACDDEETDDVPRMFTVVVDNISFENDFPASGSFSKPLSVAGPAPIGPGMAYEFNVPAPPGARLTFATMFVMSNDIFFAPPPEGIALFSAEGRPVSGDVTDQVLLWDAGTEVNQELGAGADQAPSQAAPDTGADDPVDVVRLASAPNGSLPAISDVMQVTITPGTGNEFTVRIDNVSTESTLQFTGGESAVLLSPGVWVVHTNDGPLFRPEQTIVGGGLEELAEDGNPDLLTQSLANRTGITGPISPGVFAVHPADVEPLFSVGEAAPLALESLAEDGAPSELARALGANAQLTDSGAFDTPHGMDEPAPAPSGGHYAFTISAERGDRLSLATMLVQSNDLFFSFGPEGLDLFTTDGELTLGDVSSELALWDAGTERNEFPGVGANQAPRQSAPNTGPEESQPVAPVNDAFEYPDAAEFVRVTITPQL